MSSVPAKTWSDGNLATFMQTRVMPSVVPLLPRGTEWASFEVAMRAAMMANQKLLAAFADNPNSGLLAVIKCARLGLSLDPALQHFAMIPYKGVIEGQAMYRGWLHLVQRSPEVEWVDADVIYKQEVEKGKPFLDPVTNKPTHVAKTFERDGFKDEDIVGAYCVVKVRNVDRLFTRVLTIGEIKKRKAQGSGGPAWQAWFPQMCRAKAIKALCSSGMIPVAKETRDAARLEDLEEMRQAEIVQPLPTAPTPLPPPAPAAPPPSAGKQLFDAANKEPLPEDAELKERLLNAIAIESTRLELGSYGLAELATKALGGRVVGEGEAALKELSTKELDAIVSLLMESKP